MLKKLLKYDLRRISPILLVVHAAILFFSFLSFAVMHILGIRPFDNIVSGIYATTVLIMICVVTVFTNIYLGVSYYRSLYSDEGYLTNTLPVKAGSLVFSKFLCGALWVFLDYLLVLLASVILFDQEFGEFFHALSQKLTVQTVLICGIVIITEILTSCLMVYCAVAIGSFFHGHRIMGCIGGYILLYLVNQILAFIVILPLFTTPFLTLTADNGLASAREILAWMNRGMGIIVCLNLVLGILYYLICLHTLDKKLEMD